MFIMLCCILCILCFHACRLHFTYYYYGLHTTNAVDLVRLKKTHETSIDADWSVEDQVTLGRELERSLEQLGHLAFSFGRYGIYEDDSLVNKMAFCCCFSLAFCWSL